MSHKRTRTDRITAYHLAVASVRATLRGLLEIPGAISPGVAKETQRIILDLERQIGGSTKAPPDIMAAAIRPVPLGEEVPT